MLFRGMVQLYPNAPYMEYLPWIYPINDPNSGNYTIHVHTWSIYDALLTCMTYGLAIFEPLRIGDTLRLSRAEASAGVCPAHSHARPRAPRSIDPRWIWWCSQEWLVVEPPPLKNISWDDQFFQIYGKTQNAPNQPEDELTNQKNRWE